MSPINPLTVGSSELTIWTVRSRWAWAYRPLRREPECFANPCDLPTSSISSGLKQSFQRWHGAGVQQRRRVGVQRPSNAAVLLHRRSSPSTYRQWGGNHSSKATISLSKTVDAKSGPTLECARTHSKIVKMIDTSSYYGQTGYADWSDRFKQRSSKDLKPQAREGPIGA